MGGVHLLQCVGVHACVLGLAGSFLVYALCNVQPSTPLPLPCAHTHTHAHTRAHPISRRPSFAEIVWEIVTLRAAEGGITPPLSPPQPRAPRAPAHCNYHKILQQQGQGAGGAADVPSRSMTVSESTGLPSRMRVGAGTQTPTDPLSQGTMEPSGSSQQQQQQQQGTTPPPQQQQQQQQQQQGVTPPPPPQQQQQGSPRQQPPPSAAARAELDKSST